MQSEINCIFLRNKNWSPLVTIEHKIKAKFILVFRKNEKNEDKYNKRIAKFWFFIHKVNLYNFSDFIR
jgi:hypothetical protein